MDGAGKVHGPGTKRHKIALALQGGGSHGAFTWGVLDRLLQDPDFEIVGVTGTSPGAMNAVVLPTDWCAADRPRRVVDSGRSGAGSAACQASAPCSGR